MFFILYSLFIILFIIIALFSFPQFSPIPYFPSNRKDLRLIIRALQLKNHQSIIDLGAGDGVVIFEAAKQAFKRKLNTQFVAVEINPVLLCILYVRQFLHPNRKNIRVMYGNMFSMDLNSLTHKPVNTGKKLSSVNFLTFYVYISPWHLDKTIANIKNQFKHFSTVSYMYEITSLKLTEKIKGKKHPVFVYNI